MDFTYVPKLVARRLVLSLERKNWDMAEEAADELAEVCDGDWRRCRSFIADAQSSASRSDAAPRSRADREARLACERLLSTRSRAD